VAGAFARVADRPAASCSAIDLALYNYVQNPDSRIGKIFPKNDLALYNYVQNPDSRIGKIFPKNDLAGGDADRSPPGRVCSRGTKSRYLPVCPTDGKRVIEQF
jgi:hypothetical protein